MKKLSKVLALLLAISMCLSLAACSSGQTKDPAPAQTSSGTDNKGGATTSTDGPTPEKPLVLKLGHMGNETNPLNTYTMRFKDRVEERTNGAIQIEVYGDRVLGADRELLEAIQMGTLDMAVTTTSPLTNFVPAYLTLDLPYLISDWDHCYAFFDSDIYDQRLTEGDSVGLTVLSLAGRGFRHVTTNDRPIRNLNDIKGLKLRVIESSVYVDTFTAFGANPQAMSFGEVFTALQQGTIDGHENSYLVIQEEKVYEVQNTVSETAHMFAFFDMVIGTKALASLPEDMQEIIRTAALEAGLEETQSEQATENDVKEFLKTKGVTIVEDVDVDQFKGVVQPVYDKFAKEYDDTYLKEIQALVK